MMSNHAFKDDAFKYLQQGLNVVPGKRGTKSYAFKGLSTYTDLKVNEDEALGWINSMTESNIDLMLGKVSGVVALDFDCVNPEIIKLVEHLLPQSPVEKRGSKGWTRFFRYTGEKSYQLSFNGEVIFEILSDGKKTTMPGSLHPSGMVYKWTGSKPLYECSISDLPLLPPFLIPHIESKLRTTMPTAEFSGNKIINGRNDALSSLCGKLIQDGVSLDDALKQLIEYDEQNHENPFFSDEQENNHTERFTNALRFYSSHLESINAKRFRQNKSYELPMTASAVNQTYKEEILGKQEPQKENLESLVNIELPEPQGALLGVYNNILDNSFIKQPHLAMSASIILMATLIGRKVAFLGNAPNLYVLNVAPSGSGKDAPQQTIKNILIELIVANQDTNYPVTGEALLGAGDYVSDASLMDPLATQPVRLDIIDEASGLLKSVNNGGAQYNTKMADILCELYTTSNNIFLGRQTAEGRKGVSTRPNVSVLMSTTPRGFEESVSLRAVEKGLLGRVLVFLGSGGNVAERLRDFPRIDNDTKTHLETWGCFRPPETNRTIQGRVQCYLELNSDEEGNALLDKYFLEFDNLRRNTDAGASELPIIARMFQQLCKVAMIHACSRLDPENVKIEVCDIEFAYAIVNYNFRIFKAMLNAHIHVNKTEAEIKRVLSIIGSNPEGVNRRYLSENTKWLNRKQRNEILLDLVENGYIVMVDNGKKYRMV